MPSRFAVCYGGWPPDGSIEPSSLLSALPTAAVDVLRAKDTTVTQWQFGSPGHFSPISEYCSDVTTEEARILTEALDDAGFERLLEAYMLAYRFEAWPNGETARIYFEPYLPHGESPARRAGEEPHGFVTQSFERSST